MTTEKQILQEKISNTLVRNEKSINENLIKFDDIHSNMEDHIITLNGSRPIVRNIYPKGATYGELNFMFGHGDDKIQGLIHNNALLQMGNKLNIPTKYVKDMANGSEWQKNLIGDVLSEHFVNHKEHTRFLLRSVHGELRAFLSDKYRRLNSQEILANFIKSIRTQNAVIYDMYTSDIKNYINAIHPEVFTIPTTNNGEITVVFGMRIANSDFGAAAFDIRSYMMQVVCLNGMVGETLTRQVHLGRKLPDELVISQETYEKDTATQISLTNDMVKQLFSKDHIEQKAIEIQEASAMTINIEAEIKKLTKISNPLRKEESETLRTIFMDNNPNDGVQGGSSLFKLVQGVSALGHKTDNNDRKKDLEEISGKLMNRVKK